MFCRCPFQLRLAARAVGIEAPACLIIGKEAEEPPGHRNVFKRHGGLHLVCKVAVEQQSGDQAKPGEQESPYPRENAKRDSQAPYQFEKPGWYCEQR